MLICTVLCLLVFGVAAPALVHGQDTPALSDRPVVRVVYFIPTDRKPEPDYRARIDRVMTHVQQFYREGMEQNGYGKLSFELERDADGALRIHDVAAQGKMRDYGRNDAARVSLETRVALAKQNIQTNRETLIIFQLLLEWDGDKATELGPYVGGGGPRNGTAYVFDDAKLDPKLLDSREKGGYYHRPCSIGEFNTHYIGGVAHELGHALGLPHECEHERDRLKRGRSLMGAGNHTYGQELRGEGRGAFLTAASALPLSVHPLFTGKRVPALNMTCRLVDLAVAYEQKELVITGRLEGGPRAVGIVAFNDQQAIPSDYDAVSATSPVDTEGKFRVAVGDLRPGDYQLRLSAYGASGDKRTFSFEYTVDREGLPDLKPFTDIVWLSEALAAYRDRDEKRLAEIATEIRTRHPENKELLRKGEHLAQLLSPKLALGLSEVKPDMATVRVGDLRWDEAAVGWAKPLRNQVLVEGDASPLLSVGGTFFDSGLYAHAPARHVLQLDGQWKQLTTQYGLQDGHDGSVVFVIKGDGKELYRSAVVRDRTVREQTVELPGIKKLELLVEDAGDGTRADWGVWLAPQLQR